MMKHKIYNLQFSPCDLTLDEIEKEKKDGWKVLVILPYLYQHTELYDQQKLVEVMVIYEK